MHLEPVEPAAPPPGAAWMEIIRQPTNAAFAAAFTPDATLTAGVLAQPAIGASAIRRVFEATRTLYEAIGFTDEDVVSDRTYLHWEGRFEGRPVSGITVLTRTQTGLIACVALYHRPLAQVVAFAAALMRRLSTT